MIKVNWLMRGAGALIVAAALSGCADNGAITADEAAQISATAPYVYAEPDDYADASDLGGYDYGIDGDSFYYPGGYWHDHLHHPNDGRGGPFHDFGQGHFDGRNGLGDHSFAGSRNVMHFAGGSFDGHSGSLGGHLGGFGGHVGGFGGHAGGFGGHAGGRG
jgi:hypothetical protein